MNATCTVHRGRAFAAAQRGWVLAGVLAAIVTTAAAAAETTGSVGPVPQGVPSGWVGYLNARFGLRVDLPASGFRHELAPNGSGVTLTSSDGAVTIVAHANRVASVLPAAGRDAAQNVATLLDDALAQTRRNGGSVTYSVRHSDFYVISGYLGDRIYYERLAISPACPGVFDAIRVTYPPHAKPALDPIVTRVSRSLQAVCPAPSERAPAG